MVLRVEALREKLLRLHEVVEQLAALSTRDRAALADLPDRWLVERGLQVGAELLFGIGQHILSAHFGVTTRDYEEIAQRLGAHGVLSPELVNRLRGLGGFRNLLVHDYAELDPVRVLDHLADAPADFGDFTAAIRRWLDAQPV